MTKQIHTALEAIAFLRSPDSGYSGPDQCELDIAEIIESLIRRPAVEPTAQWIPCSCGYSMPPGHMKCVKCGAELNRT